MRAPKITFWQSDWLTAFGITIRQVVALIVLVSTMLLGLVLKETGVLRGNSVYNRNEIHAVNPEKVQARISEIEKAYYLKTANAKKATPKVELKKIDLNHASESELVLLPGIGPKLAKRILDFRKKNGKFSKITDVKQVKGIGEKKFNRIQSFIKLTNE